MKDMYIDSQSPKLWDKVSENYSDEANHSEIALAREIEQLLLELGIGPGSSLLEAGCGSGHLSGYLASKGFRTTLLDFSKVALEKAEKYYANNDLKGDFINADMRNLSAGLVNSCDVVWNSGVLEHFGAWDVIDALKKMGQVARQYVVVLVPNAKSIPYLLFRQQAMENNEWEWGKELLRDSLGHLAEAAGLEFIEEKYIGKGFTLDQFNYIDSKIGQQYQNINRQNLVSNDQNYLIALIARPKKESPLLNYEKILENVIKIESFVENSTYHFDFYAVTSRLEKNDILNQALNSQIKDKDNQLLDLKEQIENSNDEIEGLKDNIQNRNNEIEGLKGKIQNRNNEIEGLKDNIQNRNNEIEGLKDNIQNRNNEIEGLKDNIQNRNNEIEGLKDNIQDRNNEIEGLKGKIQNRNNEAEGLKDNIQDRNNEIEGLKDNIQDRNNEIEGLKGKIQNRNNEIEGLKAILNQRESSLSWRFSQFYGKYFSLESSVTKTISAILNRIMNHNSSMDGPGHSRIDEEDELQNENIPDKIRSDRSLQVIEEINEPEIKGVCFGEKKNKVSIVLPVYNQADLLEEAIKSVLAQTYQNFELIIVNDGSTDNIKPILDKYAECPRILILTQENQKLPKALTNGFSYATGEFHTWTSADNIMLPQQLEEQVRFLQENLDADMVYCNYEAIDDRGVPLTGSDFRVHNQKVKGSSIIHLPGSTEKLNVVKDNFIGACFMYRATVSKVIGEYDPNSFGCEDYDYWMRINNLFKIRHLGKKDALYKYRVHDNTISAKAEIFDIHNKVEKLMEYETQRKDFYDEIFDIVFLDESPSFEIARKYYQTYHNAGQLDVLNEIKDQRAAKKCILFSNNTEMGPLFKSLDQKEDIFKIIVVEAEINENTVDTEVFEFSDWIITLNERSFNLLHNTYPEKVMLIPSFNEHSLELILKLANCRTFYRLTRPDEKRIPPQVYLNRKLNVLIETRSLDKGGLEQVIFDLATNLNKDLFNVFILCIEKTGHIADKCKKNNIPVFLINGDETKYERIITEYHIDMINPHYSNFGVHIASKSGIPVIPVIHNNYVWLEPAELTEFREVDDNINKYIAVSKNVSRYSRHHFGISAKKIEVLPNGLNLKRYNGLPGHTLKNRMDFGIDEDNYVFLHVAACQGAKGHNLLISAMKDLVVKYPDMKVISVGHTLDFNYCNKFKERIKNEGLEKHILSTGFVSEHDLIDLYRLSDAFLLPSLFEGWSISMMEAMYFGLPLILTDVGASRDVIKDNDIGIIVPNSYGDIVNLNSSNLNRYYSEEDPENTDHLKSAMIDLYENKEEWKMRGKKGTDKIESYYNMDNIMKKYEDLFAMVYKRPQ